MKFRYQLARRRAVGRASAAGYPPAAHSARQIIAKTQSSGRLERSTEQVVQEIWYASAYFALGERVKPQDLHPASQGVRERRHEEDLGGAGEQESSGAYDGRRFLV